MAASVGRFWRRLHFAASSATPTALGTVTLPEGGELKGIVTLGGQPAGNIQVQPRRGGMTSNFALVATRTMSDGSYSISAVAGLYDRVCVFVPGTDAPCDGGATFAGEYASASNVPLAAGQSNTLNIAIP
jgi:hypothetical protein